MHNERNKTISVSKQCSSTQYLHVIIHFEGYYKWLCICACAFLEWKDCVQIWCIIWLFQGRDEFQPETVSTPMLVICDKMCAVAVEPQIVLKGDIKDCLLFFYFVNIQCPKACLCTFTLKSKLVTFANVNKQKHSRVNA